MRLLPRAMARVTGSVWLGDTDLMQCSAAEMNAIRGRRIGMIFQEPMTALDPVFSVGNQIAETVRSHFRVSRREAKERAVAALDAVGIPSAAARFTTTPTSSAVACGSARCHHSGAGRGIVAKTQPALRHGHAPQPWRRSRLL